MNERADEQVGLCASCVHARIVRTPRSVFWRCALSETDARFAKYPRLPVLACDGYARDPTKTPGADPGRAGR